MPEICFITTCMGRLAHLRETMPTVAAQGRSSVLVDYSCPDRCGEWVEQNYPRVKVVRAGPGPFQRGACPQPRRCGGQRAWLCFSDADIALDPSFSDVMLPRLRPGHFYLVDPYRDEQCGMFICSADDFARSGGFDVVFRGWGWEELDLYDRLRVLGMTEGGIPGGLIRSIAHSDESRTRFYETKSIAVTYTINRIYSYAKIDWMKLNGTTLDIGQRQTLYNDVTRAVARLLQTGQETNLQLDFRKGAAWKLSPEFSCSLVYTLRPPARQEGA